MALFYPHYISNTIWVNYYDLTQRPNHGMMIRYDNGFGKQPQMTLFQVSELL